MSLYLRFPLLARGYFPPQLVEEVFEEDHFVFLPRRFHRRPSHDYHPFVRVADDPPAATWESRNREGGCQFLDLVRYTE